MDTEFLNNQRAIEHALAQQQLEGLRIPDETLRDLESVAAGRITIDDALRAAHGRFSHDKIFQ